MGERLRSLSKNFPDFLLMAALVGGLGFAAVKGLEKVEADSSPASVSQHQLRSPRYSVERSIMGSDIVRVEGNRSWASLGPERAAEEGVREVDKNCGPVLQSEKTGKGIIFAQVPNREKCFLPLYKSKSNRQ